MKLSKVCGLFQLYDRVIFNNIISNSDINLSLSFFKSKSLMGVYIGYFDENKKMGHIKLSKFYCKKIKTLESTLIHEMVHCIQAIKGLPVNHGKYFKSECKRIKKQFNINIK
jgi:hypothetical protein